MLLIMTKITNNWTYREKIVEKLPEDCEAFVYLITNLIDHKKYVGKKLAKFKTNPKWKISEKADAMIRIVDIDKPSNKQLMFSKKTRSVPEFVLLVNGKYDSHKVGFQSAETIGNMYNKK